MIRKQARLRNHPNVLACEHPNHDDPAKLQNKDQRRDRPQRHNRVLKAKAEDPDEERREHGIDKGEKFCPFHERKGHELIECKAFGEKSLDDKTKWIKNAGLCFRCLIGKHCTRQCKENVKCYKCKSNRHPTILHKERVEQHDGEEFGIYHPKKPDQIRVVFDSSCEYKGASLNKELLVGPDLMNSLLGVLMRFRQESVGVMCDVEQMFHLFYVDPAHRDFLRFLWFKDNDPSQEIIEYKMTVHLFGNSPSPAVATFGMRKAANDGEEKHGADVKKFICEDFYVDDGLTSQPVEKDAISLVKGAQAALATANLRLHKVASNSIEVMEAFSAEDRATIVRDLDLRQDTLPAQRTLGVQWDLEKDVLTFSVNLPNKPFTRRGVLSVVNSIYDPLGLAAPVVLVGKLLLQHLVVLGKKKQKDKPLGWDEPLPDDSNLRWQSWRTELPALENVSVSRCYHPRNFGRVTRSEIHAFSDASKDAIATAVYLKQVNEEG